MDAQFTEHFMFLTNIQIMLWLVSYQIKDMKSLFIPSLIVLQVIYYLQMNCIITHCTSTHLFCVKRDFTNFLHSGLSIAGFQSSKLTFLHFIPESWWEGNATIEDWFDEMVGQANIINRFGGIKMEDIRGIRVPCKFLPS